MAVSPQEVVTKIYTFLTANLTLDPNPDRAREEQGDGRPWITKGQPHPDSAYPKVGVFFVTGPMLRAGIGNTKSSQEGLYQISIMNGESAKFDYEADGTRSGSLNSPHEVTNNLATKIMNLIEANQAEFQSVGLQHLIPINETPVPKKGLILLALDFEGKALRT